MNKYQCQNGTLSLYFAVLILTLAGIGCGSKPPNQNAVEINPRVNSDSLPPKTLAHDAGEAKQRKADEDYADLQRKIDMAEEVLRAEQSRLAKEKAETKKEMEQTFDDMKRKVDQHFEESERENAEASARNQARLQELLKKRDERIRKEKEKQKEEAQEELDRRKKDAEVEAALKAAEEYLRKDATRNWTIGNDGQTLKAQFLCRIGDKVKLKKDDGTELKVSVDELSEADRDWIENRAKGR
jgi:hypothetical protein